MTTLWKNLFLNQKHNKIFQGRKVVFNKTSELVANSMLVITHASESVNFAVVKNLSSS